MERAAAGTPLLFGETARRPTRRPGRALAALIIVVLLVLAAYVLGRLRSGRVNQAHGGRESAPERALAWSTAPCLSPALVRDCVRAARGVPGFGPPTPAQAAALEEAAAQLSAAHAVRVTGRQLLAVRTMEIALATQRCGARALRLGAKLAAESRAGRGILELSARHRLPPLAVLRQVLAEDGRGPAEIRDLLSEPSRLPPGLAAQAAAVFAADYGSRQNADLVRAKAQAYEDAVGAELRRLGAAFKTEDDLRREQAASGAPLCTPDFLFDPPVLLSAPGARPRPCRWLDAKNYMNFDSPLVARSLAKQAAKYAKRFGPGAFVFAGGTACDSELARSGVLLLDGSRVPAAPTARSRAAGA